LLFATHIALYFIIKLGGGGDCWWGTEYQETLLVEMLQMGRSATDDLQQLLQGLFTVVGGSSA
jgi:hypothetical protein